MTFYSHVTLEENNCFESGCFVNKTNKCPTVWLKIIMKYDLVLQYTYNIMRYVESILTGI